MLTLMLTLTVNEILVGVALTLTLTVNRPEFGHFSLYVLTLLCTTCLTLGSVLNGILVFTLI